MTIHATVKASKDRCVEELLWQVLEPTKARRHRNAPPLPAVAVEDGEDERNARAFIGKSPGRSWKHHTAVGMRLRDALAGFHSARLGTEWRVVHHVDETKHAVIVEDIQHRSAVYRRR